MLLLIQNAGRVVSKDELMKAVWANSFVEESNLTQTVFMLRKALGERPGERYILTVPGQGYRFVAQVVEQEISGKPEQKPGMQSGTPSVAEPANTPTAVNAGSRNEIAGGNGGMIPRKSSGAAPSARSRARNTAVLTVTAALIIGVIAARFTLSRHSSAGTPRRTMLAVLPFQNLTPASSQDYFSDGMTEELLTRLGSLNPQQLGVIARTSVMHYKGSQAPLEQIARELGVDYVLEGSVRREEDKVRISAQLIQVKDQTHIWAREYDRELKGLLTVQGEIAQEIADEIELALGHEQKTQVAASVLTAPGSYQAYDFYLRGLYFWNKRSPDGFQRAADYFQRAIAEDPNYARAYAGLANSYGLMSTFYWGPQNELMPKARAAALKALQIEERTAEAHTALGLVAEMYDYDWPRAEKEFRRAIELDPNYATAHQWYGEFLSWQGRFSEALAESEQARKLDPLSLVVASDYGAVLWRAHQFDAAITQFRAVLDMDPNFGQCYDYLISSYVRTGQYGAALQFVDRYIRPHYPDWTASADAVIYGEWGRKQEAEQALATVQDCRATQGSCRNSQITAYVALGKRDQAMSLLENALAERSNLMAVLKTEPSFDGLHSDPRFQDLLRRLKLQ
jgi:TolB-like protein/DNA-binding winged helix-turn-helix (wHTH) protein/Tfp pilus assembly protein PilF